MGSVSGLSGAECDGEYRVTNVNKQSGTTDQKDALTLPEVSFVILSFIFVISSFLVGLSGVPSFSTRYYDALTKWG